MEGYRHSYLTQKQHGRKRFVHGKKQIVYSLIKHVVMEEWLTKWLEQIHLCTIIHIRRDNGLYQALEVLASDKSGYLS